MRLSLFYVATYLTGAGLGMTFMPQLVLDMMLSNTRYELAMVRMAGLFVLGLAGFVIQMIRHHLRMLYPTVIAVRVGFCIAYVALYAQTRDPFFLTTLAIVGAGLAASTICLALDRRAAPVRTYVPEPGPVTTIEANGLTFAALEWGSGPLVLLLHGFPDSAHTWDEIGPAIARDGYRVVAPFMRGYAPTARPTRDADIRTLGTDIIAIIEALGADTARVIGHDWGAEALYAAAAIAPHRIERMVAIAIPHRGQIAPTPRLVWSLRHFIHFKLPGAAARFKRDDYAGVEVLYKRWSPTWRYTHADLEAAKNVLAAPGGLHATLGYYRAAQLQLPAFQRALIDVPALAIAGADDPNAAPELYERARPQFRAGYDVVAIPGGHFCHRESPAALLAATLPFLRAVDPAREAARLREVNVDVRDERVVERTPEPRRERAAVDDVGDAQQPAGVVRAHG